MAKTFVKITSSVGGGILVGLAAGFVLAKASPLAFLGSVLVGLGIGIIVAALISDGKKQ